jgi:hypothetical protein
MAGQLGELLAAQAGGTPPAADRHADRLGGDAVTPAAQRLPELPRLHGSSLRPDEGVVVALAVLGQPDYFFSLSAWASCPAPLDVRHGGST